MLKIAYGSYSASLENTDERLRVLYKDMLILAKQNGFDVCNLTEVCQHKRILDELMFKPGAGKLHHYIYNWKQ